MRKIRSQVLFLLVLFMSACNGDDNGTIEFPDIEDLPFQQSIGNLESYSVTITLIADGRLDELSIKKDDVQLGDVVILDGDKEATYNFSYTATQEDSDSFIVFEFALTDRDGNTRTERLILVVGNPPRD